jgi:hypothetical protein
MLRSSDEPSQPIQKVQVSDQSFFAFAPLTRFQRSEYFVTALLDAVSSVSVTGISTAVEIDEKVVTTDQKCKRYSNMQTRKVLVRSSPNRIAFPVIFLREIR